jgi:hypothetical protein
MCWCRATEPAPVKTGVVDFDLESEFVGQLLQLALPQAQAHPVAAAAISGDDEAARGGVTRPADLLPPAPNAVHGKAGRVMVEADTDRAVVGGQVIDPVGNGAAQLLDQEVVNPNRLGITAGAPRPTRVLEVPDQLLLLGIDRDDRLLFGQSLPRRRPGAALTALLR